MKPVIDHIHITVADLDRAEAYYDRLLPLLGFDPALKEHAQEPAHDYRLVEYHHPLLSIGLVSPRAALQNERPSRRKAGALHHLAFGAQSRQEVDRLYRQVLALPAVIVHPPRLWPEYCPDYYAFFFKDCEGIEYEIVHFDRERYFPQ